MPNNILRKASSINIPKDIYKQYNLKENPFPMTPFISQESLDKRYNGDIYESSLRVAETTQIEKNFLQKPQSDPNHIRVGYILDTSYVGRGNGKSSFALNLIKKINSSYCLDISNDVNKCFGIYLVPEASGKTKSFSNLLDKWVEAIFNSQNQIIDYALAALRLEVLLDKYPEVVTHEYIENNDVITDMNSLDWFNKHEIPYTSIETSLRQNDIYSKINLENPLRINHTNYNSSYNYKIVSSKELYGYYNTLKKESDKMDFIFNDLVCLFMASGFNGAYIIVDDFERIPDFQSDRQKRDFALELRTNFFDGSSMNVKYGFYNLILMLHAGVPRLIEKAWSESGMEQRSSISSTIKNAPHIVHFNKLDKDRAILLIKKYLTEYRLTEDNTISPFTEGAIEKIGEEKEYNAAQMLSLAHILLEDSAEKGIKVIDVAEVNSILQKSTIEVTTVESIIDEDSTDLQSKAAK